MVWNFMVHNFKIEKTKKAKTRFNFVFTMAFVLLMFTIVGFSQSGRNKSKQEVESAKTKEAKKSIFVPASVENPKTTTTPTPTPKPATEPKPIESPDDVIRINSTLIPIPASVTDISGKPVIDLKLEDFTLSIDGEIVEINELSRSDPPVRLAFLFDNSSSVIQAREFEQKAAIKFFKQVIRPKTDLAALYSVSTYTRLEQPFTRNISDLVMAINSLPEADGGTQLLEGIIKASEYLKDLEGRRIIVVLSDGDDTLSDVSLEQTVQALQRNNCQIYVVKTTEFENFKRTGVRTGSANTRSLTAERRMQELAFQTGGAVYSPIDTAELDLAFTRIAAELSSQYILSYYPADAEKRGTFRNISLQIKTAQNLTIRTRKGYFVTK
jgi:Ca-activated chloride channel homolog